jgi:hypothetical protein
MSPKRLLPLIVILIVLGVLAVVLKRAPVPTQLAEEVGLEHLVPQTLRVDSIRGFDLYQGAHPQDIVRVRQRDGAWVVPSRFEAPGNSTKIQQFLTQFSTLQGELRADSTALLGDFRLTDEQALHLKVYTDAPDQPAFSLLVGKGSGSNSFVRRAGEGRVYSVNLNLYNSVGLSSGTTDQIPTAKPWLDLHLQNMPKEQVAAVDLHTPRRELRFITQPTAASGGTETSQTSSTLPVPAWQLVSPALTYSVKQDAVEGLVTTLRTLQGDDVADPAKVAEYGLDTPPYRATLTLQPSGQEARQVAVLIGNDVPEKSGSRYARLGDRGPVYVVPEWAWQRLFPTLGTLLDLHLLQVSQEEVTGLMLQHDGASWSLERRPAEASTASSTASGTTESASTWQLVGAPEAQVDALAVTSLLGLTAQLNADDLPIGTPSQTGLDRPPLTLTLTLRDGRTERLILGQAAGQESSGYYASRGDTAEVFIVSSSTYKALTDAAAKLKPASASTAKAPTQP